MSATGRIAKLTIRSSASLPACDDAHTASMISGIHRHEPECNVNRAEHEYANSEAHARAARHRRHRRDLVQRRGNDQCSAEPGSTNRSPASTEYPLRTIHPRRPRNCLRLRHAGNGKARVKISCAECGVVDSVRRVALAGNAPAVYEITIRMRDESTRVVTLSHGNWRPRDRITLIGGANTSGR